LAAACFSLPPRTKQQTAKRKRKQRSLAFSLLGETGRPSFVVVAFFVFVVVVCVFHFSSDRYAKFRAFEKDAKKFILRGRGGSERGFLENDPRNWTDGRTDRTRHCGFAGGGGRATSNNGGWPMIVAERDWPYEKREACVLAFLPFFAVYSKQKRRNK